MTAHEGIKKSRGKASHLGKTGKINQGQVKNMGGVDLEVNGLSVDALVVAGDTGSLVLDLALDVAEVVESSVRDVMELCPLGTAGSTGRSIRIERGVGSALIIGDVDELKDQGPTGDDAASSR